MLDWLSVMTSLQDRSDSRMQVSRDVDEAIDVVRD